MKLRFFLFLLFLTVFILAQKRWGKDPLSWYTTRYGSNNEKVRTEATYISGSDTFYSKLLDASYQDDDGVWNIVVRYDSVDAPSDSIYLDVARYHGGLSTGNKYMTWHNIIGKMKSDTTYELYISPQDCTWNLPCNKIMYRTYRTDTNDDSLSPYISDYRR